MLNKSDLLLWVTETIKRLGARSPRFFRTWGFINIAIAAIGAIPDILKFIDITLPEPWMLKIGKIMFAVGVWGKIQSALAVSVPTPDIIPFTEKKNIQS